MGANATTSVPKYTAGDVLTAANLSITNSGIPVFANSTDRTNAFGGTGEKTLAEGQFAYLEDDNKTYYYDGAAWQEVGGAGLKYITGASFTTATSFSLPNSTFTTTYRNYKIIIQLTALTADADFTIRMRASGTDDTNAQYDYAYNSVDNTGSGAVVGAALQTSWLFSESDSGNVRYIANIDVIAPQLATSTMFTGFHTYLNKANTAWVSRSGGGAFRTATQFDALSFISSVASSMTGVYRVYGYADA